uniref:non-specific serine/threonine protein kinase n=1 Tax=Salix viminalis TaxID=40686 RepID=A0A6N2KGK6_SALVM
MHFRVCYDFLHENYWLYCRIVGIHDNCLLMHETSYEEASGQSRGTWTCTCSSDGLPKVAAGSQDTTCFTACNCTSALLSHLIAAKSNVETEKQNIVKLARLRIEAETCFKANTGSLTDAQATRKHISSTIVVVILLCVILTILAFLTSITWYLCRKDKFPIQSPSFLSDRETSCNSATNLISHRASSVSEAKICVDSPTNPLSVSGQLKDGTTVAVKLLKAQGGPDADLLFSTEVELLAKLHHCHVVPLLGYCMEFHGKLSERLLVFEYMSNGNLRDCLDGITGENMNWKTRVAIAIGAARGLEYLHEAAAPRILHRDVKSTNILMDELWRAKITDLGMAKRLRADGVPSSSSSPARMQGTFGYFAPEYAMIGRASLMSDVFSFGVVLLEVITGRQPIHKATNKVEESLVLWATPRLQDSRRVISELPDPRLKGNFPEEELQIMAYLAKECLLLDPDSRPSMSEMSSIQSVTTDPYKEKPDSRADDAEEVLKRERLYIEGEDNISTKYMERLILSTSKTHIWGASDDEAVDLTEPRLESFCVENRGYHHPLRSTILLPSQVITHAASHSSAARSERTVEDAWIHVYGFCAAVAYFHAAALHCLSLCRLLSKAAFP